MKDDGSGTTNDFNRSNGVAVNTISPAPINLSPSSTKQVSGSTSKSRAIADGRGNGMWRGPYVDKTASKNITALLGKTAYLNCRVKNLGNTTVSDDKMKSLTFCRENQEFKP